jgi:hypothetical protein
MEKRIKQLQKKIDGGKVDDEDEMDFTGDEPDGTEQTWKIHSPLLLLDGTNPSMHFLFAKCRVEKVEIPTYARNGKTSL